MEKLNITELPFKDLICYKCINIIFFLFLLKNKNALSFVFEYSTLLVWFFFIKILSNLNEFIIDILENQFLGKFYVYNFLGTFYNDIIKNFYYLSTTEDFRYTI